MPAVLVDVGLHMVEPNASGQTVSISVASTDAKDAPVGSFDLRAQIVTAKQGPNFQGVRFAGDLWNTFPHVESGSPFPANPTRASGVVSFTQGLQARADGTLVTLTIDTRGIPAGSYEFRLVGTQFGSSSFRRADGSSVAAVIANGTLQVRSIWQNPDNPNDVDGDGKVTPRDALLLLNELNKKGAHELGMPSLGNEPSPSFDVNGDGHLSPLDPLSTINCLNGLGCITTPPPILARVTPDYIPGSPGSPGSTGVGTPPPAETKPQNPPPAETSPTFPTECVFYGVDENGSPVAVIDPYRCHGSNATGPVTVYVDPNDASNMALVTVPIIQSPQDGLNAAISAAPTATVPSPISVDAVITDIAEELANPAANDELVDLGLGALFAFSS
ncbi:MAG: dockerin type I domain-containing protein [Planctomycetota bacterium]